MLSARCDDVRVFDGCSFPLPQRGVLYQGLHSLGGYGLPSPGASGASAPVVAGLEESVCIQEIVLHRTPECIDSTNKTPLVN